MKLSNIDLKGISWDNGFFMSIKQIKSQGDEGNVLALENLSLFNMTFIEMTAFYFDV
jgi:hypothetical protein